MPEFTYQARNADGELISGQLEGPDSRSVATALVRQGYHPVRIESKSTSLSLTKKIGWKSTRVNHQEILILFRELTSLLRAGISLSDALDTAAKQSGSESLEKILRSVTGRVHGGSSFSEALSAYPSIFPELYISMIKVGETAGILDQVLERLAVLGTQEMETRSRLRSALVYPLVLISFALLVVNGLLIGVLPKFVSIFQASQIQLPMPTRVLLACSNVVQHHWWALLIGLVLLVIGIQRYYTTKSGRWAIDTLLLKVPITGDLYQKILITRFTRTLGSMLKTGVPMLEAISVSEKTLNNVVFQRAIQRTYSAVSEGKSFAETLASSNLFPHMVIQLVTVGEKTGQLDAMLQESAAFYEPEIEMNIRNFTTLLEPVLLLTMGIVVGFIALSVLLPIFQLIHVFRR